MKIPLITATLVVVALTVIPAVFDGQRRFRWGEDSQIITLSEHLQQFPKRVGNWESGSDLSLDDTAIAMLQPIEAINRTYVNSAKHLTAHVFILLGPVGPTAAHSPDVCFDNRDFRKTSDKQVVTLDSSSGKKSECFAIEYQSRDATGKKLKSWHAWTIDGTWHAPNRPRIFFANNRFLLKVQIAIHFNELANPEQNEVMEQFVTDIEKTLKSTVF